MSDELKDKHGTTGHEWDGIEELNTPLPRWWLYTFYATIVWGVIYTILYPAWPLVNQATSGLLGFSTRAQVEQEITAMAETNAAINQQLVDSDLTQIAADPELNQFAVSSGGAVFRTWCAQCHGSGAAGAVGYPNLLDDDWLWGGDIEEIHYTVTHGIRNEEDADARYSQMPAFGADGLLDQPQIRRVVNYVMSLSGEPQDPTLVAPGAPIFAENCASCHGDDGTGDRDQGAPDLTDAIWLYGGDFDTLMQTVTNSRFGVMPAWSERLTEAQIRAVSVYVHGLGGGE
ncbi:cytochrome-c oxidase, cbb3-type subunit III [Pseudooceanicola sp. LIPI14-2-Ac024]|uniref:cytochrome-c oxidase, cbb3-type subunit III n=1 Tax=Pseudooceanicola sp. LIPI14-2-Ac024 TaxID=3344875 RepID=UPI0035D06FBD